MFKQKLMEKLNQLQSNSKFLQIARHEMTEAEFTSMPAADEDMI